MKVVSCWAPFTLCLRITPLKLVREITPCSTKCNTKTTLVSFRLRIIQRLLILFFILQSLSFKSGVSLWDRDLQNFGPKAKNRRLFHLVPVCVYVSSDHAGGRVSGPSALLFAHLFSCSRKHLWNTVSWQHSQDCVYFTPWTAAGSNLSLAEPSHTGQSTCYGLSCTAAGRFSLERVAWSRPGYPNFEHEYVTVSFGACVSVKQWPRTGRACGPSALLFVSLAAVSANISETRHDASSQSQSQWMSLPRVGGRTITLRAKQMLWALAAQLWPFSWRGCLVTAWLPTMNVILFCWAPLMPCFGIASLKLAREITPSPAKTMIALEQCFLLVV